MNLLEYLNELDGYGLIVTDEELLAERIRHLQLGGTSAIVSDDTFTKLEITEAEETEHPYLYATVKGLADVRIKADDEGLVVDIFDTSDSPNVIGSTWVTWEEMKE